MAAEMIQMLEGLNLHGLGTVPSRIRERFEPRAPRRRAPIFTVRSMTPAEVAALPRNAGIPPAGAREAGDGGPLGDMDNTVMTIVKFGALTAVAGGLLYMGSRLLHRRVRSRRRRR